MYSNKEKFIKKCTYNGYIKSNKLKYKECKKMLFYYLVIVICITILLYLLNKSLFTKYWFALFYAYIPLFFAYLVHSRRYIISQIANHDFKLKKYEYINQKVKDYFQKEEATHMKDIFSCSNGEINYDKAYFYVEWIKENELAHKYDGIFEKALLAGIFIPIWNKCVDIMITLITTNTEETITRDILLLGLLIIILVSVILSLKNSVAAAYLDFQNAETNEYRLFRNAIMKFIEENKFK